MKIMLVKEIKKILFSLVFLIGLSACSSEQDNGESSSIQTLSRVNCLRECLENHLENYLEALAAQDLSRINTTEDVVFVENNQTMALGDGSWKTMTGLGDYRHYFVDPQTSQVAVISTMEENGQGIIYDLRLKLEGEEISEIESLIIRAPHSAALYDEMKTPPENFLEIIPEDERNTREELLATTVLYFEGMENNIANLGYPFFDIECNRIEHAVKTTNNEPQAYGHSTNTDMVTMTCEEQFNTGFLSFVTRVRDKRYMVIDEERQTVFGMVFLDHNGTTTRNSSNSPGNKDDLPTYFSAPRTLMVGEAWRVRNKKLLEIEMTLNEFPYGTRPQFRLDDSRWQESRNINPGNIRIQDDCHQQCLNDVTNNFLDALIDHDYSKLPLSANVRYKENGQLLAIGDGLWGTITRINDYQVYLSNPEAGEAGFFGSISEVNIHSLLSVRIQINNGLIQDVNVSVLRHELTGERGGTVTLFAPQIDNMYAPEMFAEMETALNGGGNSSMDDLISLSNSFSSDSRESVILLADTANGLVLQQSIKDITNASSDERDPFSSGSYSVLTSTLYKFNEKELILTKSISKPVPYKMAL